MSMDQITAVRWIPSTKTFGARLALVRWRMGWNLSEAAEACGLPEANWREWELNGRTPRNISEVALTISERALGVDDYWLSTGRTTGVYPDGPEPVDSPNVTVR
jgi:transcriptional regulator with XRE-family HTH domain